MNLARWSQTQFLNFNKSAKKIVREKKQKKTSKKSIFVCRAPSLKKSVIYPIHIVLSNMIIVVKYILARRKRERYWMLNYYVSIINEINYKLHHKSIALLIVKLPMKSYIYIYIYIWVTDSWQLICKPTDKQPPHYNLACNWGLRTNLYMSFDIWHDLYLFINNN